MTLKSFSDRCKYKMYLYTNTHTYGIDTNRLGYKSNMNPPTHTHAFDFATDFFSTCLSAPSFYLAVCGTIFFSSPVFVREPVFMYARYKNTGMRDESFEMGM